MVFEPSKSLIRGAVRGVLRPIVRLLLKSGWTWKEFAELAKTTYVEVATNEFGLRGRPTNASRVAILTGLDRREVRRQRERLEAEGEAEPAYMSRASRVLSGWHQDPDFLQEDGQPRVLGPGDQPGFETLVHRYAGDVPATAMLKELRGAGALERLADGRLRVLKRSYIPRALDDAQIRLWGSVLQDVGTTLEHNLTRDAQTPSRFERRATSLDVDARRLPAFRAWLEREGQALLERADEWLIASEAASPSATTRRLRLGVGLYHIEDAQRRAARN